MSSDLPISQTPPANDRILRLHGVEKDRDRLSRLAQKLEKSGLDCRIVLWRADRQVKSREAEDVPLDDAVGVQETICWTRRSIAPAEKAFWAFAITCKEQGTYLGLLLDEVLPPEPVTGSQDVRLTDWNASDDLSGLKPLLDALTKRRSDRTGWTFGDVTVILDTIAAQIRKIRAHLNRFYLLAIGGSILAVFAFLGSFSGNVTGICQLWGFNSICGWLGAGGVATDAETIAWKKIEKSEDCAVFERYLAENGNDAAYSAAADKRLGHKKMVSGPRLNVTVAQQPDWMQPFSSTQADALAAFNKSVSERASSLCQAQSRAFIRLNEPARFRALSSPQCRQDPEGYRCGASIEISCVFEAPGERAICPF
jgi:hypothetical protein